MPTAAANVLRDAVHLALRAPGVATAAAVSAATWAAAEDAGGHVFPGDGRYLFGRNRGRLPFLEVWITAQNARQLSYDGGTLDSVVLVRAHVGGRDIEAAEELAHEIIAAAVRAVRYLPEDYYTWLGDEAVDQFRPGPWGHQLDVRMTVRQVFGREETAGRPIAIGPQEETVFSAINLNAGTLRTGQPVYVAAGGVNLADASAIATAAVALAGEDILTTETGDCQTEGIFEQDDWSLVLDTGAAVLVAGTDYFLSETTGKITATAPTTSGAVVQFIGTALSTTALDLRIAQAVVLG